MATYVIVEHRIFAEPPVTEISYWDGGVLITRTIPNPCPFLPGGEYTEEEIDALATATLPEPVQTIEEVMQILAILQLGGVASVLEDTRANLEADLVHAADTVALVYADPIISNRDFYIKAGASGSGAWTKTTAWADSVAAAGQATLDAAAASAAAALASELAVAAAAPIADGYLPTYREFALSSGSSNIVVGADGWFERSTGTGTALAYIPIYSRDLTATIKIRVPVTGAFSLTPRAQYYTGVAVGALGSEVAGTLVGSEYHIDLPAQAGAGALRLRWTTTSTGRAYHPYVTYPGQTLINPATQPGKLALDTMAADIAATTGNHFSGIAFLDAASFGSVGTLYPDRRTVLFRAGSIQTLKIFCAGVFPVGSVMTVLAKIRTVGHRAYRDQGLTPQTGLVSGSGVSSGDLWLRDGFALLRCVVTAAAGAPASQVELRIDNRNGALSEHTAIDETLEFVAVLHGDHDPVKVLADPERLLAAIAAKQQLTAIVDATGSIAPHHFGTLADAVRRGYGRIEVSAPEERTTSGLAIATPCHIVGMAQTDGRLPVFTGGEVINPGDLITTAANATVRFIAQTHQTRALWERTGTSFARMGKASADTTLGKIIVCASEAEVRTTIGGWWWGTGSEGQGLYLRPYGDITSGKTWERPARFCSVALRICGPVTIEGLQIEQGSTHSVQILRGAHLTTAGMCAFPRAGLNNGLYSEAGSGWTNNGDVLITDATNDGAGGVGSDTDPATINNNGVIRCIDNQCDGVSFHQGLANISGGSLIALNNGKSGVVHVSPTNMRMASLISRGNRGQGFYILHGSATPEAFHVGMADIDTLEINKTANTAATTGRITGRVDTIVGNNSPVVVTRLAAI